MAFGVTEAQARDFVGAPPEEPAEFGVIPENWPAVRVFVRGLGRQWRYKPLGGVQGIIYEAIPPTFTLMGIPRRQWPALFEQIQVMEATALEVFQAKR